MTRFSIGQPVTQVEAPRLLTGNGRFTDDIAVARQAHAVFVRSPHAHADILGMDLSAAASLPGVLAILTGDEYAADGLGHVTGISPAHRRDGTTMFRPPRPALTQDRVRHVGQLVAMVIAETLNQARDAAETIAVDYAILPAQLSTAAANRPETPALWPDCPDNEAVFAEVGDRAAVDAALAGAAHVVRETFVINRITANPMEPRAVVADYDAGRRHYTIHACQQRPHVWRTMIAKHLFHIAENNIRLIAGDVGGSFGMKGVLYPEVPLVAWASRRLGRPVRWTCERSEAMVADDQARDMVIKGEMALDRDGRFLAVRLSSSHNLGAYVSMTGFVSTWLFPAVGCGPYRTPAVHGRAAGVLTNTIPVSNYRGPAGAPGSYVLERLVDMAAAALGLDGAEIRRRNLISAEDMPSALPTGGACDSGEFEAVMDKCLGLADYAGVAGRKQDSSGRGKLRGVGMSTTVDASAAPSPEVAELRFDPGGTVTVLVGSTAGGQGHETIYSQIVCEMLGLEAESIRVVEGDTDRLAWGNGTGNTRTTVIAGSAVLKAADKIIRKGRRIAAHLLEAAEGDVEFDDGSYRVAGTDRAIPFAEVARAAFMPGKLPTDIEIGLYETATWSPAAETTPNSCHVCEVEIDPETGCIEMVRYSAVHDVGTEINPLLVAGQVHGGIAQAAGQACMEDMVYDAAGQVLTGSLMDYCMPRADDFCHFEIASHPVPTATNPLGVKGAGECGTVGGLAAVMNAINDALGPLGIRNLAMPATPERVWRAIRDAR
jgi:carbon-monoxide dehydrogenase large subunit